MIEVEESDGTITTTICEIRCSGDIGYPPKGLLVDPVRCDPGNRNGWLLPRPSRLRIAGAVVLEGDSARARLQQKGARPPCMYVDKRQTKHPKHGADAGAPCWIEIKNLECIERCCSRKPDVCLTLLECPGEVNPYTLQRLTLGLVDTYGPCQDERYLEKTNSDPGKEHRRKVDHLSSCGFYFPVYVFDRELDGNHHHLSTTGPEDDRPKVRAIQYMAGNVCLPPGGVIPHLVVRVYESYVRIPVDSFACGQEVDDLADGSIYQHPMYEILKLFLINLW